MELTSWDFAGEIVEADEGFYAVCAHTDCEFSGATWSRRENAEQELEAHEREEQGR